MKWFTNLPAESVQKNKGKNKGKILTLIPNKHSNKHNFQQDLRHFKFQRLNTFKPFHEGFTSLEKKKNLIMITVA